MSDAGELLKLLREIETKDGPISFRNNAIRGDASIRTVWASGRTIRVGWANGERCVLAEDGQWAIVGALMEDMERPYLAQSRSGWHVGFAGPQFTKFCPTPLEAVCRAWLAAKGAKRVS